VATLTGAAENLLSDFDSQPPFGRWLLAANMDGLPSLWNLFVGDMSLVGPQPLLMRYFPLYSENQARRHLLLPGLTGWARVNGRNAISWEEKFELDVRYVDHRSFWFDIKILWLTVIKVINREGISADDDATMPRFEGTK
jgi:lipopolysaccharide/colanic/teichoic acid biosynthesis glycosyltransferase